MKNAARFSLKPSKSHSGLTVWTNGSVVGRFFRFRFQEQRKSILGSPICDRHRRIDVEVPGAAIPVLVPSSESEAKPDVVRKPEVERETETEPNESRAPASLRAPVQADRRSKLLETWNSRRIKTVVSVVKQTSRPASSFCRSDLVGRVLHLAPTMLLVPLLGPICLGWTDGPDDLDKCRKLTDTHGGLICVSAIAILATLSVSLPPGPARWTGGAQTSAIAALGIIAVVALWPLAELDVRVSLLWLAALGCAVLGTALRWRPPRGA